MDGYTVVEVWVLVDADGNYVVHHDGNALEDRYEEEVGRSSGTPTRIVRATLNVPTPKLAEVCATIAEEASGATVAVA